MKIKIPGKFAKEIFIITDDNKVVMPKPVFERQRGNIGTLPILLDNLKNDDQGRTFKIHFILITPQKWISPPPLFAPPAGRD